MTFWEGRPLLNGDGDAGFLPSGVDGRSSELWGANQPGKREVFSAGVCEVSRLKRSGRMERVFSFWVLSSLIF